MWRIEEVIEVAGHKWYRFALNGESVRVYAPWFWRGEFYHG